MEEEADRGEDERGSIFIGSRWILGGGCSKSRFEEGKSVITEEGVMRNVSSRELKETRKNGWAC